MEALLHARVTTCWGRGEGILKGVWGVKLDLESKVRRTWGRLGGGMRSMKGVWSIKLEPGVDDRKGEGEGSEDEKNRPFAGVIVRGLELCFGR